MSSVPDSRVPATPVPFASVLCIGETLPDRLLESLRRDGIGVICSRSHVRGMELLRHFQASAVICADATVASRLALGGAPVLLLVTDDGAPGVPGVTVLPGHTDPTILVRHIRDLTAAR